MGRSIFDKDYVPEKWMIVLCRISPDEIVTETLYAPPKRAGDAMIVDKGPFGQITSYRYA